MNRILGKSNERPRYTADGTGIRRLVWKNNVFLDALYWLPPCNLSKLARTYLNEDLKDLFPYNAVKEEMVVDKDSRFGTVSKEDYSG